MMGRNVRCLLQPFPEGSDHFLHGTLHGSIVPDISSIKAPLTYVRDNPPLVKISSLKLQLILSWHIFPS